MRPGNPRPSSPDYDPVSAYGRDRCGEVNEELISPSSPYYDPILAYDEMDKKENNGGTTTSEIEEEIYG